MQTHHRAYTPRVPRPAMAAAELDEAFPGGCPDGAASGLGQSEALTAGRVEERLERYYRASCSAGGENVDARASRARKTDLPRGLSRTGALRDYSNSGHTAPDWDRPCS
ncbi:hypothetical protein GCM10027298_38220 [Epidermidibacterium keratini]